MQCLQLVDNWQHSFTVFFGKIYNIAVPCLFIFQLGADVGVNNPTVKSMKAVMRIMAVIAIPLTAQFPAVSVAIPLAFKHVFLLS